MNFFRLMAIIGSLPITLTNGTTADATQVMSDLNWIVNQVNANAAPLATTALTNANNNFTVVQSGIAASAAANFPIASQVQNSSFMTLSSTLGTNTLLARIAALPLGAYAVNQIFTFVPSQTNTGPASINIDSLGSGALQWNGLALGSNVLQASRPQTVVVTSAAPPIFELVSRAVKQPTRIRLTSGTGATYTTPLGCTRIDVRLVGGGGGGGAQNTNNGTAGANTTFGASLTAGAGGGGGNGSGAGGVGGTATGGDLNIPGGAGNPGSASGTAGVSPAGGIGGATVFGGAGIGGVPGGAGGAAAANSGAGGGGSGGNGNNAGSGGGAGGYVEKLIVAPSATYAYGVGAAGTGGAAGGSGGGDGAAGIIIVDEFYD